MIAKTAASPAKSPKPGTSPKDKPAEFQLIALSLIDPHPDNPRGDWDNQKISALVPSIRHFGVLQPIIVRPVKAADGERYQLVAGERRYRAAKEAGLAAIKCRVRPLCDEDALAQMLIENLQRKDLSTLETARTLQKLCEAGASCGKVAKVFGMHRSWVAKTIRLLQLPEAWQEKLARREINRAQARMLVRHCDSPEFLKRVEDDMAANPWAWQTGADFKRNIGLLLAGPDDARPTPGKPRTPRTAQSPPPAAANDRPSERAAKAKHAAAVDALCAAVADLSDFEELTRIETAVKDRRAFLRAIQRRSN